MALTIPPELTDNPFCGKFNLLRMLNECIGLISTVEEMNLPTIRAVSTGRLCRNNCSFQTVKAENSFLSVAFRNLSFEPVSAYVT
jgi:hypothetical protein